MKPLPYRSRAEVELQKRATDAMHKVMRLRRQAFENQLATETPDQYLEGASFLNPRRYLDAVYRNVPGGANEAIRIANEYGANLDPKSLDRQVSLFNNENLDDSVKGVYSHNLDAIIINPNAYKTQDERRNIIKHELQHAIMRNAPVDRVYPKGVSGKKVSGPSPGDSVANSFKQNSALGAAHLVTAIPSMFVNAAVRHLGQSFGMAPQYEHQQTYSENPSIDNYYGQSNEADAEFFSKVKHWGAEQGILPKNEAEARALLDLYMKRTGLDKLPAGEGQKLKDRAPAIRRKLFRSKYAPVYLLRSVKNDNISEDSNV